MKIRESTGERIFNIINLIILAILTFITLYPLVHVLNASLSSPSQVLQQRGLFLFPKGINLAAYEAVFKNPMVLVGYKNTAIYVLIGTAINLVFTTLGAYCLSRQNLYFRNIIMFFIAFTMIFSGGLIPTYLLVDDLHLVNTRLAVMLPNAISVMNLIIMRTSFQAIPISLEESAKLDGASDLTIIFKIILPLSMPVVSVMLLFYGVRHWNSWFDAMIYFKNRDFYPLQLVLREILISNSTEGMMTGAETADKMPIGETIKYATIIVATVPILLVYPFLQKYFVKGVMIGAIKG